MGADGGELTGRRRATLADKGRRLYGKYCGTRGRGICAESFAIYHLGRGEILVAQDLLAYLEAKAITLTESDPRGQLPMTCGLVTRIRQHIADATTSALPLTGEALRHFVLNNAAGPSAVASVRDGGDGDGVRGEGGPTECATAQTETPRA